MPILTNKVILVTGGSTGIGRATAEVLGAEGARVIIADLQDQEGEKTAAIVNDTGGDAEYHHVDVGDYDQVKTQLF